MRARVGRLAVATQDAHQTAHAARLYHLAAGGEPIAFRLSAAAGGEDGVDQLGRDVRGASGSQARLPRRIVSR